MNRAVDGPALGSVQVQVVLFRNEVAQLLRMAEGLATTLRRARAAFDLSVVNIRFGDSSPEPCLDSAAVEELVDAVGDAADEVTYRFFGENLGSAGGSNELASGATEDVLWVLNPDTYPSPTSAEALLVALRVDGVAAAEAHQIPVQNPKLYDAESLDTEWVSGFCVMLRRSAFEHVGGFDAEHFPLYCDDVDLSWRLRLAGHRVVHVPDSVVFHDKRVDARGLLSTSETTVADSALARFLLARRYGRPDVEEEFTTWITANGTPAHRQALDEYRSRRREGRLPDVVAEADRVAVFVGNDYAHQRFAYLAGQPVGAS